MRLLSQPRPAALRLGAIIVCGALWTSDRAARQSMGADSEPEAAEQSHQQPEANAPKPSLDDELLKDLDNELLEGAGAPKDRSKSPPSGGKPDDKDPAADRQPEAIDDTMPAEDADPLVHISDEMRQVEELIPKLPKRSHAQQLQQRIVDDLARLIDQAEAQRAQQRSSATKSKRERAQSQRQSVKQPKQQSVGTPGKDSNKPATDSTSRLGKAEPARPDPELFKGMMKDAWGHLPPRDREQVLQNTPDKFLPQYELMIEKYYKRLAEDERSQ
jgi:hypothetical protein